MSDALYDSLLTQTCTIKSRSYSTSSTDDWGVPSETITTSESSEACLIQSNAENVTITISGKKETASHIGFFKSTANINLDDIVDLDGVSYQVIGVNDSMGQGHHQEVLLKKMDNK